MNMRKTTIFAVLVLLLLSMIFAAPAGAQEPTGTIIVDKVTDPSGDPQSFDFTLTDIGGFESGDLAGWTAGGTEAVEVLQSSYISPTIAPPQGDWFALLSTGPGNYGVFVGYLDDNEWRDWDASTLRTTFNLSDDEVPAPLSFEWAFITGDNTADDFFMVTLDGVAILTGSVPGEPPFFTSPFPDTPWLDGMDYTVVTAGPTGGSYFGTLPPEQMGFTGFQSFNTVITAPGSHTLEFLVADQHDGDADSGLLVDDVNIVGASDLNQSFSLTDGAAPHDSGPLVPGVYSVAEAVPAGWDLTATSCSDGSPVSNIDLDPGEVVTCTFTNTQRGRIIIDIKPFSDPNSINLKSKGMVPVAVLSTDSFDASSVDPDTVSFAGASPVRWATEDVDGDGDMDLLFHFKTQDLADLDENSTEAFLKGYTHAGGFIWGTDTVNIVPKDKGK